MGALKELIKNLIISMLYTFDANITDAARLLKLDFVSEGGGDANYIAMHGVYTFVMGNVVPVITATATVIVAACFLIEFMKMSIKLDSLRFETGIKFMIKFAVAKSALDIAPEILIAVYHKGSSWIGEIGETINFGQESAQKIALIIDGMGGLQALAFIATMGAVLLALFVSGIIINVMAWARAFELLMYFTVAPLPCAFIPLENSQITRRFLLSFAGVVLQGTVIVIVIKMYAAMCSNILSAQVIAIETDVAGLSGICYNMLLGALILVIMTVKSGSWAKAVLGS